VGPCHYDTGRPQVAAAETVSDMQDSCEYTEYAVADAQGVVLQLGWCARCRQLLTVKTALLRNMNTCCLGLELILRYDISNGKGTWDSVPGMLGACRWQVHWTAAARELARCKLDLVFAREVRWDKGGTMRAEDYNFFCGKVNKNHQVGSEFLVHHRIVSTVNTLRTGSFKLFKRPFPGLF